MTTNTDFFIAFPLSLRSSKNLYGLRLAEPAAVVDRAISLALEQGGAGRGISRSRGRRPSERGKMGSRIAGLDRRGQAVRSDRDDVGAQHAAPLRLI